MPNFANDDVVLFVNLTSVALSDPELGLSLNGTSSLENLLQNGGVETNGLTGGTLEDVTIDGLPAGSVWATLVPASSGTVYVNATLAGWTVNSISGQTLGSNSVLYITTQTPQSTVGNAVPSFQAVTVSPDSKTLYGINTDLDLLVVASTADLSQLQTFANGLARSPAGTSLPEPPCACPTRSPSPSARTATTFTYSMAEPTNDLDLRPQCRWANSCTNDRTSSARSDRSPLLPSLARSPGPISCSSGDRRACSNCPGTPLLIPYPSNLLLRRFPISPG